MPYLLPARLDIPNETIQVLDLWPNESQRNLTLDPRGETCYVRNIENPDIAANVAAGPPVAATADIVGLAAYLIGNIDTTAGAGSAVFSAAEAETAADGIVAIANAGTALDKAAIDGVLAGVVAGTTIDAGGSTGVVEEVIAVLAGRVYTITAGTDISDGAGNFAGRVGSFNAADAVIKVEDTGQFQISLAKGNLEKYTRATFTYIGSQTAAVGPANGIGPALTVYDDDGTVLA